MSNRKIHILVLVCSLAGAVVWALYAFIPPRTDGARYREMLRTRRSFAHVVSAEKGWFGRLVAPLHISDRYIQRFDAQREALLSSGYLTNISIAVSNATGRRGQVVKRLDATTKGTDIVICQLSWRSNAVLVTCRPQDMVRLRHALGDRWDMKAATNKITGANAGEPPSLPIRARRAARIAQFWPYASVTL